MKKIISLACLALKNKTDHNLFNKFNLAMLIKCSSQLTERNNVCTLNEFFKGFYPLL